MTTNVTEGSHKDKAVKWRGTKCRKIVLGCLTFRCFIRDAIETTSVFIFTKRQHSLFLANKVLLPVINYLLQVLHNSHNIPLIYVGGIII